jgi:hypothetical protein
MRFYLYAIVPFVCFLLSGCLVTYGDTISRSFTKLNGDSSIKQPTKKPMLLFFDGEPITFEYTKIGLIEVKGDPNTSTTDLLNHLKYEAFKNGGDAVIVVKDGYATRQSGVIFSKTPPTNYTSHIFSGIAIKIKKSLDLIDQSSNNDTTFISKVKSIDEANAKRTSNQFIGSFVIVLILTGVLIYAVTQK